MPGLRAGRRAAARGVWTACLLAAAAGCRDRAAEGGAEAPPSAASAVAAEGVQVELEPPDSLAWAGTHELLLRVANRGTAPLAGARLLLQLPPRVEAVGGAAAGAAGGPLALPVAALAPGQAAEFTQRIRLPAAPGAGGDTSVAGRRFVLRSWVAGADGRPAGPVSVDTLEVAGVARAALGCGAGGRLPVTRFGVGAVRLGMPRAEIEGLCPGTADTAWVAGEGLRERGLRIPFGPDTLLATLAGDTVARLRIVDTDLATAAGLRVGTTLGDLRTRLGRTCAGVGEGRVAVWFPNAPGISFALSAQPPAQWSRVERDPALLPDTARVTEMWVRRGTDDCPVPAPAPAAPAAPAAPPAPAAGVAP